MTQPVVSPLLQAEINAGQVNPAERTFPSAAPAPETPQLGQYTLPDGTVEYLDPVAATIRGGHLASQDEIDKDDQARRLLQQVQAEGYLGTLKAAGEGVVGGLVPGGIDLLRSGMTPEERELAAARSKKHDIVSMLGEGLGMAAQHAGIAALTGGIGEAANISARAAAAARPLAERVLEHGTKAVLRGALTGGQLTFNEESRENLDHDAERIAHGALIGAILEPVIGVPAGLMGDRATIKGITSELSPLPPGQTQAALAANPGVAIDWAAERVAGASGRRDLKVPILNMEAAPLSSESDSFFGRMIGKVLGKVKPEIATTTGERAIAEEAALGTAAGREARIMAEHADQIADKSAVASTTALELGIDHTSEFYRDIEKLNFGKLVDQKLDGEVTQFGRDVIQDIEDVRDIARLESGRTGKVVSKLDKYAAGFRDQYDKFTNAVAAGSTEEKAQAINVLRRQLGDALEELSGVIENPNSKSIDRDLARRFFEPLRAVQEKIEVGQRDPLIFGSRYAEAIKDVHGAISNLAAREKAMNALGLFGREGEAAWNTYRSQKGFRPQALSPVLRNPSAPGAFKQAELIFGGTGAGDAAAKSYLELVTDLTEAANKHFASPRGREMTQDLLAANFLTKSLKEFTNRAFIARDAIQNASAHGGQLFSESALRIAAATLGNLSLGPAAIAPAYAIGGGVGHALNYGKRVHAISSLENMLDKAAKRQQAGIVDFVARRGQKPGPPVIAVNRSGALVSAFRSMASNPTQVAETASKMTQSVSTFAPKLAGLAAQKVAQVVSYINERIPAPVLGTNLLQQHAATEKPYAANQVQSINRMLTASFRPDSILTHPSIEGSQLVKDLYPNDFAKIQLGLLDHISTMKAPLSFTLRQQLAIYFDLPSDVLTDPKKYVEFQDILTKSMKSQGKAQPRPVPVDIAESFATTTNKVEAP